MTSLTPLWWYGGLNKLIHLHISNFLFCEATPALVVVVLRIAPTNGLVHRHMSSKRQRNEGVSQTLHIDTDTHPIYCTYCFHSYARRRTSYVISLNNYLLINKKYAFPSEFWVCDAVRDQNLELFCVLLIFAT